ncbi:MAG: hydroxyacid dehydrogenase [Halovenus sp.]|uniref:hydroxyacid dehydrogenase n=1 Tax=Halovenus amylolytica TaxID=2500550 RepID=UPI000FE33EDF
MTDQWEVLLPIQIDPSGPESIADFAQCTSMGEYSSYSAALDDIGSYEAVVVRTAELDAALLERADRLQVIAKHGTGLDNVDIEAASARDIVVCNTPGANAQSVAEHAIALLFGVHRKLHMTDRHVRAGNWERSTLTGHEIQGDTLGLLGFGDIAQIVASLGDGIEMDVLAYDPFQSDDAFPDFVEPIETVPELFDRSDAVSIHVPLNDETRHMVSTAELEALGEEGVLINTSRGAIVEEAALIETLEEDQLAGAGLDTFAEEPPGEDHPLYARDELLLSPHVGGTTDQALERMSRNAADNIRTVYEGGIPESAVNADDIERGRSR